MLVACHSVAYRGAVAQNATSLPPTTRCARAQPQTALCSEPFVALRHTGRCLVAAQSTAAHAEGPAPAQSPHLAPRLESLLSAQLTSCTDLESVHGLLLEQAGRAALARPPPSTAAVATAATAHATRSAGAWTGPADVVAAFAALASAWRASPQRPVDAALLADALQHSYALLRAHQASLSPRETAAVIVSLGALRSASPEVLRQLAEALGRPPASTSPASSSPAASPPASGHATPTAEAAAGKAAAPAVVAAAAAAAASAAPTQSVPAPSGAPGLLRLSSSELAEVVGALAAFNVRPGDAWLGQCMGQLQLGLTSLRGPQLVALLWGLVQLGVRPTTPWLALYEEALSACLEREERQLQQQQQQQQQAQAQQEVEQQRQHQHQQQDRLGNEELVRVLGAVAEVGFQPGPRCRELLLAAAGRRLAGGGSGGGEGSCGKLQPHQLAALAWAVARLRWRVGGAWCAQFVAVSGELLPHLRPADLPPVVAFLAAYQLQEQQQEQQGNEKVKETGKERQQAGVSVSAGAGARAVLLPASWTRRCLASSLASLPQTSPRQLPDLLLHMLALQPGLLRTAAARLSSPGGPSGPAAAGSAGASGHVVDHRRSEEAAEAADDEELAELAAAWLRRYLAQCGDKLARFTAGGLARMLLAVARAGVRPEAAWLEAACAALASKHDVLAADDLADAVVALATLRRRSAAATQPPPPPPLTSLPARSSPSSSGPAASATAPMVATASASASSASASASAAAAAAAAAAGVAVARSAARAQQRLLAVLLAGSATKLSLLRSEQLVGMAAALAELDARPHAGWLSALLEESQNRLTAASASASAAAAGRSAAVPVSAGASAAAFGASGARGEAEQAPSTLTSFSAPAATVVTPSARLLPPRLLTQLLVAVAKMDAGTPSAAWQRAYLQAVELQLDSYDSEALGGLVWALVVLGLQPPPAWMAAVMARARTCLEEEAPAAGASPTGGSGLAGGVVSLRELMQGPMEGGGGAGVASGVGEGAGAAAGWEGYSRAATQGLLVAIVEGGAVGSGVGLGWPQPQQPQQQRGQATRRPQPARGVTGDAAAGDAQFGPAARQQGLQQAESSGQRRRRPAYGYVAGPYKRRSAASAGQHRRRVADNATEERAAEDAAAAPS
ncbi:hypothetical protein HYH02_012953 [Chlamydomonas schloesseri]|uniref:Uncharacterized protein n=1 Tax=Chlamydomonas schloesseri TaxID=2026947 RepID=A0A835T6A9_9CHLO|nr:hypothetical protein HYH02_012953 [Chlamydomonas schloesseri]|eukprot:KAG2432381.1 hypothetical protein HYH02_012953 [Chlamydomonas schloesseri]